MERRQLALYTLLTKLGEFGIENFKQRLFAQKAIYLAQLYGFDFSYRFSWYKMGPYSPDLTKDLYDIDTEYRNRKADLDSNKLNIKNIYQGRLNDLSELMNDHRNRIPPEKWLELLSSIHYLKHISKPNANLTRETIRDELNRVGKEFNESLVFLAWDKLEENHLIESKALPAISE